MTLARFSSLYRGLCVGICALIFCVCAMPFSGITTALAYEATVGSIDDTPVRLNSGHIDIGPVKIGNEIHFAIGDDSHQHATTSVWRSPEAVTFEVGETHKVRVPDNVSDTGLGFLGAPGSEIYFLSQTQQGNSLWPGFSSEHADGRGWNWEIATNSLPEGARWWAYTSSSVSTGVQEMLASYEHPSVIERSKPVHLHNNWVFSSPGTYVIDIRAVPGDDYAAATQWHTLTFEVGGADAQPQPRPTHTTSTQRPVPPTSSPTTTRQHDPIDSGNNSGDNRNGELNTDHVEITKGHIDLGPVKRGDRFLFALGDESYQHSPNKEYRDPSSVTMVVGDHFKHTLSASNARGALSFAGNEGDTIYFVDQTQHGNALWPGFSSEHADGNGWDFELDPVSSPAGSRWWAYTADSFGGVQEMFGSHEGSSRINRSQQKVHVHNNWIFTHSGTYVINMRAIRYDGHTTDWAPVTFRVGEAVSDAGVSGVANTNVLGAATSTRPSAPSSAALPTLNALGVSASGGSAGGTGGVPPLAAFGNGDALAAAPTLPVMPADSGGAAYGNNQATPVHYDATAVQSDRRHWLMLIAANLFFLLGLSFMVYSKVS
ncbi:putative surface-anchored membrane protein [Corynebacterium kutscheri]|uniref:choice-of-anchor M domain-containing protein n=1 Tax=Corynebacterium kutscheri TaxID=35755 RepID=UPI000F6F46E7|nr:choice-of-anchor M domain-containing protein [Corynebacterium kutscheri]VEH81989.1 putative surface-anchored membrane protein [Corynebacterium kutscheri]